jgi:hypothetical protein
MPRSADGLAPRRPPAHLLVVAVYVLLAMIANLPAWLHGPSQMLTACPGACRADPAAGVWSLAFFPYSLLHGHDAFVTGWLNYPYGVNLMANASVFLLGLIVAPVTLVAGPVLAFNVLMVLAISGSATAAYFLFRRWTSWRPAAVVGGLLYGFSPYLTSQAQGHLNLMFVVFPPLALLMLDEVLVRQRHQHWRLGIGLGLLASGQFFISPEVLASSVVLGVAGVAWLLLSCRHEIRRRLRFSVIALGSAALTGLVVCGYPFWVLVAGRDHVTGPFQPRASLDLLSSDLLGSVLSSGNQWLNPTFASSISQHFTLTAHPDENGAYLGIALVLVLALVVVRSWRAPAVRFAAVLGVGAWILSLGPRLVADGNDTGIPLPFAVIAHLPLLKNSVAARYSLYVALFAGMLLAIGLDRLRAYYGRLPRPRMRLGSWAAGGVAAVALIPLIPAWPYRMDRLAVPSFFRTAALDDVPSGTVIVTYPYVQWPFAAPVLWQAVDEMRYKLPGVYGYTPDATGAATLNAPPSATGDALIACAELRTPPSVTRAGVRLIHAELSSWNVSTVVVTSEAPDPGCAVALFKRVLGRPPVYTAGVWAWRGLALRPDRSY